MPSKEELARALKAFKKRLKRIRQDDESSLGGGPTSAGRRSGIVAILPPPGFPQEVWEALVEQGRLRRTPGERTYELVQQPPQKRV